MFAAVLVVSVVVFIVVVPFLAIRACLSVSPVSLSRWAASAKKAESFHLGTFRQSRTPQ
jgi:hypothetical protein